MVDFYTLLIFYKQHCYLKIIKTLSSSSLSSKNNTRYSKKCIKNKSVCLNEVIWLMTMKAILKMKNRSHRTDIDRPRPRHGHKYSKYKMCLSIMMVTCIKQHLSNIWSSILEKGKQNWGWVEEKRCLFFAITSINWINVYCIKLLHTFLSWNSFRKKKTQFCVIPSSFRRTWKKKDWISH